MLSGTCAFGSRRAATSFCEILRLMFRRAGRAHAAHAGAPSRNPVVRSCFLNHSFTELFLERSGKRLGPEGPAFFLGETDNCPRSRRDALRICPGKSAMPLPYLRRGSANHRHNAGADRFRQRRPRGHEHGQYLRATTPGDLVRRKLLNRIGLGMRALRTHNPLVLGSNPSRPIVNARDTICRSAAQSDTRLLESRVPETTIREAMDLPVEAGANRAAR